MDADYERLRGELEAALKSRSIIQSERDRIWCEYKALQDERDRLRLERDRLRLECDRLLRERATRDHHAAAEGGRR